MIDYIEPPYHDEGVLPNEDIEQEDFQKIETITFSLRKKAMFATMHSRDMNIFICIGPVFIKCNPLTI